MDIDELRSRVALKTVLANFAADDRTLLALCASLGLVERAGNAYRLTSFSEDMHARGRIPRSAWLKRSEGTVTPEESLKLALSPGTLVYRFHRLRFADDEPMSIELATIVASCLPSLDAVQDSIYEALERTGSLLWRGLARLGARLAPANTGARAVAFTLRALGVGHRRAIVPAGSPSKAATRSVITQRGWNERNFPKPHLILPSAKKNSAASWRRRSWSIFRHKKSLRSAWRS